MKFIEEVFAKLARHPKRVVFPEGKDPRVIQAAGEYVRRKLGPAILLGRRRDIAEVASGLGVGLVRILVIDPENAQDLDIFAERLRRLTRYKEMTQEEARKLLANPNYFASMMVQYGQADGLVGGASTTSGSLLRPLFSLIKPLPGCSIISSCMVMQVKNSVYGDDGTLFFADCGVIPDPTVEQLAAIAVYTARTARQLTGKKPRVAMLSYSTRGSAQTRHTEKIAPATALAQKMARDEMLEVEIDGELQVDAALDEAVGKAKAPDSLVAGKANVLIFPDLNSGNIATKLVQRLADADAYGQILLGISKPSADISRGATPTDILGVAAIVGLQAIAYRELYPDQGIRPRTQDPATPA